MTIEIIIDESFDPEHAIIKVNGVTYKTVKNLNLTIASDGNGRLAIEHESGYLEAYQGKKKENNE